MSHRFAANIRPPASYSTSQMAPAAANGRQPFALLTYTHHALSCENASPPWPKIQAMAIRCVTEHPSSIRSPRSPRSRRSAESWRHPALGALHRPLASQNLDDQSDLGRNRPSATAPRAPIPTFYELSYARWLSKIRGAVQRSKTFGGMRTPVLQDLATTPDLGLQRISKRVGAIGMPFDGPRISAAQTVVRTGEQSKGFEGDFAISATAVTHSRELPATQSHRRW